MYLVDILYYFCLAKRSPILKNNKNTNSKMKTKLTLLKNALLVGCAVTSASTDSAIWAFVFRLRVQR